MLLTADVALSKVQGTGAILFADFAIWIELGHRSGPERTVRSAKGRRCARVAGIRGLHDRGKRDHAGKPCRAVSAYDTHGCLTVAQRGNYSIRIEARADVAVFLELIAPPISP